MKINIISLIISTFLLQTSCVRQEAVVVNKPDPNGISMEEPFKFNGEISETQRSRPWDNYWAIYKDGSGQTHSSDIPLNESVVEIILNSSNYKPNLRMTLDLISKIFLNGYSRSPEGDCFQVTYEKNGFKTSVNAVGRDGYLWKFKIEFDGKHFKFKSKKTHVYHPELILVG